MCISWVQSFGVSESPKDVPFSLWVQRECVAQNSCIFFVNLVYDIAILGKCIN